MQRFNDLLMAVFCLFLLLAVNLYLPLPSLINLLFNFLMVVATVIYIMQALGVVKSVLPSPHLF